MGAVFAETVPVNDASMWMGEYFKLLRLRKLGIPAPPQDEFEQNVLLYIDSQMDVQRSKKAARDAPRKGKR